MDEYEKLEKELQRQYEVYLARYRNIDYLEHELDLYHQVGGWYLLGYRHIDRQRGVFYPLSIRSVLQSTSSDLS